MLLIKLESKNYVNPDFIVKITTGGPPPVKGASVLGSLDVFAVAYLGASGFEILTEKDLEKILNYTGEYDPEYEEANHKRGDNILNKGVGADEE